MTYSREYSKEYYKKNKDKILERQKQWYEKNKDKILERKNSKIEDAKIYKLVCNTTGKVYYGSTCLKNLQERLSYHEKDFIAFFEKENQGYMTSFEIICEGDYIIELVEKVDCKDKKELHQRERWYIENNECVNKFIPNRTTKERNKLRYKCECGIELTLGCKARHEKSKKHLKKISKIK